ncbi:MAG: Ig-like domain-containing protein [Gemmatimonadetes bacterium]|nr:Ig-like domain-containing protein [Gemmatimonadota bacterium]
MRTLILTAALVTLTAAPVCATLQQTLSIEPSPVRLEVDGTRTLALRPQGVAGNTPVRWVSLDADIASVDETGTVRALRPGTARILAIVGEQRAEAVVVVAPLPPAGIRIVPGTREIPAGTGAPLHVVVHDRQGTELPDADVRLSTDAPGVASVDVTGRLLAHAPGTAIVRAEAGGVRAESTIRVIANPITEYRLIASAARARTGDVIRLRVSGSDAAGRETGPLLPAWSVEGPAAQIGAEGEEGVFVAELPGRYIVTAFLGPERVERVVLTVTPRTLDGEFVRVGHGLTVGHHAGDTWAFEGADGRDYAIIGTFMHDWAKVFDITEPGSPVLTDSVRLDARRINDVKIHPNNRIGVLTREGASSRRNGIIILDLSTPAHPRIISEYTETVTGGVHNVWIDGEHDLVYACHNGTRDVRIIDISDPRAPREVGRWGLPNDDRSLHDVIVQDGYAYLSYWDDGLIMLDVGAGTHGGSPVQPAFVSQFKYPQGHTHTAWRYGKYLFIGDEIFPSDWDADRPIEARGYIHVVDYANPERPVEVARYEVPDAGAHNFWVEDDILYVGYYQAGLRVVDVSGELRGDLLRQGRQMGALRTSSPDVITPNWSMTWGAQLFKGHIITSDLNSGLWLLRFRRRATTS